MRKLITDLSMQPTSYIICVHVRNFLKSYTNEIRITNIMENLELTYGPDYVESAIKSFFPNFYIRYYNVADSTGYISTKNDAKWDKLLKKLAAK